MTEPSECMKVGKVGDSGRGEKNDKKKKRNILGKWGYHGENMGISWVNLWNDIIINH